LGEIVWQPGNRVYLDTNLFIYAVEEIVPYADQVKPLLQAADRGEIELVTSLLALTETLVMPYRKEDDVLVTTYRELFTRPHLGCLWRNSTPLSWSGQPDCAPRRTVCACPMPFPWQPQHWNDATVF
jgi:hypothetical protein